MDPVKGRNLLVKPAQKKQTGREVGSAEPGQERQNAQRPRQDAPQLVLRRKEDWEN